MHGFDTADSHHAMHAFTWDPGGALYWQEGTFHFSQVETPYGPQRLANAGVFRFEPKTWKFDVFVSYSFANPWATTSTSGARISSPTPRAGPTITGPRFRARSTTPRSTAA